MDENIVTKYFIAAVQSHNHRSEHHIRNEYENSLSSDAIMMEHELNDNNNTNNNNNNNNNSNKFGIIPKSWEPKEIELPAWAVLASQK
jgi:hypothetical protein